LCPEFGDVDLLYQLVNIFVAGFLVSPFDLKNICRVVICAYQVEFDIIFQILFKFDVVQCFQFVFYFIFFGNSKFG
jgi:hypothetical protein